MVDDAISSDGSNRARNLLRSSRIGPRCRKDSLAAVVAVLSLTVLGACQNEHTVSVKDGDTAIVTQGSTEPFTDLAMYQIAELAVEMSGGAEPWQAMPPVWPDDLYEHFDASLESREWFALLVDDDDRSVVHALEQRLIRVAIAADATAFLAEDSQWSFDAVMQVAGSWQQHEGRARHWQETERAAAGLAHPVTVSSAPDLASTRVAQTTVPSLHLEGHVLGHRAEFSAGPNASERHSNASSCAGEWTLSVPASTTLTFAQPGCPNGLVVGNSVLARSGPLVVRGYRHADAATIAVSGVGWMRHRWGDLVTAVSAVEVNTLVLTLKGIGTLDIIATQRRSGRGTPVVTATRLSAESDSEQWDDVHWSVAQQGSDTNDNAGESRILIPSLGLDVVLRHVLEDQASDRAQDPDGRLRHLVIAEGTHRGAGYADIEAVSSRNIAVAIEADDP